MDRNKEIEPEPLSSLAAPLTPSYGFVERWYDAGLAIPNAITRDSLVSSEIERITTALTLVIVVGSIPRRLGGEATDSELALDKKRAKRVNWVLEQSLSGWTKKRAKIQITAEIQREGAQLEWGQFIPAHLTQLNSELALVATWAIQNEETRWGRSAVVNLENEIRWLLYAMRD